MYFVVKLLQFAHGVAFESRIYRLHVPQEESVGVEQATHSKNPVEKNIALEDDATLQLPAETCRQILRPCSRELLKTA